MGNRKRLSKEERALGNKTDNGERGISEAVPLARSLSVAEAAGRNCKGHCAAFRLGGGGVALAKGHPKTGSPTAVLGGTIQNPQNKRSACREKASTYCLPDVLVHTMQGVQTDCSFCLPFPQAVRSDEDLSTVSDRELYNQNLRIPPFRHTLNGLAPFTTYHVRVGCRSREGNSPWTHWVAMKTGEGGELGVEGGAGPGGKESANTCWLGGLGSWENEPRGLGSASGFGKDLGSKQGSVGSEGQRRSSVPGRAHDSRCWTPAWGEGLDTPLFRQRGVGCPLIWGTLLRLGYSCPGAWWERTQGCRVFPLQSATLPGSADSRAGERCGGPQWQLHRHPVGGAAGQPQRDPAGVQAGLPERRLARGEDSRPGKGPALRSTRLPSSPAVRFLPPR